MVNIYSNTTLVKVKLEDSKYVVPPKLLFKYNTC